LDTGEQIGRRAYPASRNPAAAFYPPAYRPEPILACLFLARGLSSGI
jgi:hypothetical protein